MPRLEAPSTKVEKERDDSGYVQFGVGVPWTISNKTNSYWLQTFIRGVVLDLREIGDKNAFFFLEKNENDFHSGGLCSGYLCAENIKIPLFSCCKGFSMFDTVIGVGVFNGTFSKSTVSDIVCDLHYGYFGGWEDSVRRDIAKVLVSELYRSPDRNKVSFVNVDGNQLLGDILAFAKEVGWNVPLTEAREPQKEEPVQDDLAPVLGDLYRAAQKLDVETQEIVRGSVDRIRETLNRLQGDDSSSARRRYSVLFNLAAVCRDLLHEHLEVDAQGGSSG